MKKVYHVPFPQLLGSIRTWHNLETLAAVQTVPCKYLGCRVPATDNFEPDPSKWTDSMRLASGGKGGQRACVWFEWLHVQRRAGAELLPHRVSMEVLHALHHGREPPWNPLGDAAPSRLVFSIDFMEA